jgi:hypothetical protein
MLGDPEVLRGFGWHKVCHWIGLNARPRVRFGMVFAQQKRRPEERLFRNIPAA